MDKREQKEVVFHFSVCTFIYVRKTSLMNKMMWTGKFPLQILEFKSVNFCLNIMKTDRSE